MNKLLKILHLWDGLWSVPAAFIAFLTFEDIGRIMFGAGFGSYDPAVFQAALIAAVVMIFTNTAVQLALKFNFPALWESYHTSFAATLDQLSAAQKVLLTVFMYCFFFALFVLLFIKVC
ncbi:MAG: hypothetical protein JST83_11155 [Bacteroidetes bacterium]|nr:hypothetical protein [Bacteroidota bacterium]